jgi:hypothetical protein
MAMTLQALEGTSVGRAIAIRPGHPRVFTIMKQGRQAGHVTVEIVAGTCVVINDSERLVLVNGVETRRASLVHGDTVVIGKDAFRLDDSESLIDTSTFSAAPNSGYQPTPVASTAESGSIEMNEPGTRKSSSDSDRHRRRKSISASMHSVVDQPKQSILNRLSSVFSSRSRADRGREEELQRERSRLLEEAGRQVLAGHALGLPEAVFADLLADRAVTIRPEEVSRAALARWSELTQRISLLDAEIAAVRRTLGLGPDLGAVRLTAPTGRAQLRQAEDRAFATLDALTTQELGSELSDQAPPTAVKPLAATSGRQPVPAKAVAASRISGRRRKA